MEPDEPPPDSLVEEILRAVVPSRVLAEIGYRTEVIQESCRDIKAFCPIHRETIFRTLVIDPEKKTFHCSNFNCAGHKGGNLINLYSAALDISYEEGLIKIASIADVEMDDSVHEGFIGNTLEVAGDYIELGVLEEAENTVTQDIKVSGRQLRRP
jgi:DNA primase